MRALLPSVAAFGLVAASGVPAPASSIRPIDLSGLAGRAEVVLVGHVDAVKRADENQDAVTVRVLGLVKGAVEEKAITLYITPRGVKGFDTELKAGQEGVFFLRGLRDGKAWLAYPGGVALFVPNGPITASDQSGAGFETLLKENDGGPKEAGEFVIQTEAEWKEFVGRCSSEEVRKKLLSRRLDFTQETVLVVALGKSHDILGAEEADAGIRFVRSADGKATVEYRVVRPDHRSVTPMYPLHVVRIPKVKDVEFRKAAKLSGG